LLKEYLVHLLQCDLIEYLDGERAFKTTPKGMQALRRFSQMDDIDQDNSSLVVIRLEQGAS
ncbi:MAG: hypothetical protein ACRD8Z_13620, partial [Nitrososphaeraceae archaeon]